MKKLALLLMTIAFLAASTVLYAQDSNFSVRGGIQYPDAPDKVGFDSAVAFNYGVDKYFTIGAESGFGWVRWKDSGMTQDLADLIITKVEKTNLYSVPLLAIATIRLADMMNTYGVMPYFTGGAGYSWTWFRNPDVNETFHGFTWQVMAGAAFKLGTGSDLLFMVEAGYRGAEVENSDNYELDMSGVIVRAGITFPISPRY